MNVELRLLIYSKKFRLVLIAVTFYFLLRTTARRFIYKTNNQQDDDIVDQIHARNLKAVQLLTRKFSYLEWGLGELGERPFERCAETRCYAFKNQFFLQEPLEKSDGVMVHLQNLFYMPSRRTYRRNPRQLWLFNTMEPQTFSYCSHYYDIADLDDWFNITTTFKPQSSLLTDYKAFGTWHTIVEYAAYYQQFLELYTRNPKFLVDSFQASTSSKK